ncbi:MAG: Mur ligase family protein [Patescibacteria group bacterium]
MQDLLLVGITGLNTLFITLYQIALWQRKEYRIDRMRAYVASLEWRVRTHGFGITSAVLLIVAWIAASELLAILSILTIFVNNSLRIYKRGVMRPKFTLRSCLVFVATVFLIVLWVPTNGSLAFHLATFTFFLPVLVAAAVGIVSFPARVKKQKSISKAQSYRTQLTDLTVVGITGSVGKTSTKTYLTHLLGGESETIVATFEHRNSPYSVAEDMLKRISQKTQVYIAELGAYIPGEIAELAHLTKPSIGIVTAITNQHAALFGSLAALAKTKWELIDSLPENGIAILNKDDEQVVHQAKHCKKKMMWFSVQEAADVYVTSHALFQDKTQCSVSIIGEEFDVVLPTISMGQLTPILAAICGAVALKIDSETIVQRLATLPVIARTMELRKGISGATVVDDSYSASEASVKNAILYLSGIHTKDIRLVLVPIIELGNESSAVHERIGVLLAPLKIKVFIYGEDNKNSILRGLGSNPKATVMWVSDAKELTEQVSADLTSESIVLLEGRVPSIMRSAV